MPTFLLSNPGFGQYSFVKEPLTIFRQSEVNDLGREPQVIPCLEPLSSLAFSPNGRWLVHDSEDSVRLREMDHLEELR